VKKEKRDARIIEKMAKLYGKPVEELQGIVKASHDVGYQAEAVLAYHDTRGRGFIEKNCKWPPCQQRFAANYKSVAYCSNKCRADALADIGIDWNYSKSEEERWAGTPPLVVPPKALSVLDEILSR